MFGLVQPNKVKVGQRIKEIKDGMSLFTELGNRLGLKSRRSVPTFKAMRWLLRV